MTIDVVTTAIRRPEILELAYRSYFGGGILGRPPVRIILNIDPLGSGSVPEMLTIARRYSSQVAYRIAEQANFANAINWSWEQVRSPVFMHLEDDWILSRPIHFKDWVGALNASGSLQSVLVMKRRRRLDELSYSFRPHIASREVIQRVGKVPFGANPEKFSAAILGRDNTSMDFGVEHQIIDMGRKWAMVQSLKKNTDPYSRQTPDARWFEPKTTSILDQLRYAMSRRRWRRILETYASSTDQSA